MEEVWEVGAGSGDCLGRVHFELPSRHLIVDGWECDAGNSACCGGKVKPAGFGTGQVGGGCTQAVDRGETERGTSKGSIDS